MTLGICKLCGEEKNLKRSHVIGKTVFSKILRETEGNYAINISLSEKKIKKSNDTWESRLLCSGCESKLNSKFEDYAIHVLRQEYRDVKYSNGPHGVFFKNVETYRVILYFFSIFWRAGYSSHTAYKNSVINDGVSNHLINAFDGEIKLNSKHFAVRVRLLKDHTNALPPEFLKRQIFSPYNRLKDDGFVFSLVYEGYFFELFFNASNFRERQKPGFLNSKNDFFFVPYVDVFDVPEITEVLFQCFKIHKETPDEEKIKI